MNSRIIVYTSILDVPFEDGEYLPSNIKYDNKTLRYLDLNKLVTDSSIRFLVLLFIVSQSLKMRILSQLNTFVYDDDDDDDEDDDDDFYYYDESDDESDSEDD